MANKQEGGASAPSADLVHARLQLDTLRGQLPQLKDPSTRAQVKQRIEQLERTLDEDPQPEYQPTNSHARNNGMVFGHHEVKPLPLADGIEDKRQPRSAMRFNAGVAEK